MAPLREKLARSQFQEKESMSEIKKPKMSKKIYYLKVPISTSRVSQTQTHSRSQWNQYVLSRFSELCFEL